MQLLRDVTLPDVPRLFHIYLKSAASVAPLGGAVRNAAGID
jgi:hypothetical protein